LATTSISSHVKRRFLQFHYVCTQHRHSLF
jgi:hypothetical protein